jgi:hypothetical protein
MWVIKEFRKFTMDSVAHDPASKLEYLALEKSVEQLVRKKKGAGAVGDDRDAKSGKNGAARKNKGKGKGKGKKGFVEAVLGAEGTWGLGLGAGIAADAEWGDLGAGLGADGWGDSASESESESEDGEGEGSGIWKVESVEGLKFCDVVGVRIFEKDVVYMRL